MQLRQELASEGIRRTNDSLRRVHQLQVGIFQQTQRCNTKLGMKHVHHITRPIRDATMFRVLRDIQVSQLMCSVHYLKTYLALQDKPRELLFVDPVQFINDLQASCHPPTVADIF